MRSIPFPFRQTDQGLAAVTFRYTAAGKTAAALGILFLLASLLRLDLLLSGSGLFLLMLPAASRLTLQAAIQQSRLTAVQTKSALFPGESAAVVVTVENRSRYPLLMTALYSSLSAHDCAKITVPDEARTAAPATVSSWRFVVTGSRRGQARMTSMEMDVRDWLSFSVCKVEEPLSPSIQLTVFPLPAPVQTLAAAADNHAPHAGQVEEEKLYVRPYQPGDKGRRISWRDFAAKDELVSWKSSAPGETEICLVVALHMEGEERKWTPHAESLLERAAGLAESFTKRNVTFEAYINDASAGRDWLHLPAAQGTGQLSAFLELLATLHKGLPLSPVSVILEQLPPDKVMVYIGEKPAGPLSPQTIVYSAAGGDR
ncbi:DUF58 domain-containing protein [Bacillus daqingensis]|uniref:DUF58 domain-containing protein n=1 Tax=Bacillus daqingensis TaxID=872396 RepID=A0ABV9NSR2_9BACI